MIQGIDDDSTLTMEYNTRIDNGNTCALKTISLDGVIKKSRTSIIKRKNNIRQRPYLHK